VSASVVVNVDGRLRRRLKRLQHLAGDREMVKARRRIGVLALQHQRERFREQAQGGKDWPGLSDVAVVLRRGGPRIFDEADVDAKRQGVEILRDTNRTYASLTPGSPGNVLNDTPEGVEIGTNLKRAQRHHTGGSTTFRFGDAEEKRFTKNVSPTKRGRRRPRRRADGRRHSWKGKESPWNPLFFKLRGGLRKMDGKSYRLPKRTVVGKPTSAQRAQYRAEVLAAVGRITGRGGAQ